MAIRFVVSWNCDLGEAFTVQSSDHSYASLDSVSFLLLIRIRMQIIGVKIWVLLLIFELIDFFFS